MVPGEDLPPIGVAEDAPDALLVVDPTGEIRYANREAHRLFGYDKGALVGRMVDALVPARDREAHAGRRLAYAANPEIREMGAPTLPLHGLRRDGTQFPVEIRLSPLLTDGGRLTVAAVRDATEHERVTRSLNAARDAAVQANDAKSRFVAAASHDLRQPLQTLSMINAAFRLQLGQAPFQAQLLREKQCLDAMSELLNSLLNVSKLDFGSIVPAIADFPLAPLLAGLREQFAEAAAAKSLALLVDADDSAVRTDRALLHEVLQNLLGNAIRYTDAGSVRLRCGRVPQDRLRIDVIDTGIGIDPQLLPRIWDDFYQVAAREGAVHRGGAGLGLAVVRRIAEIAGLAVRVESAPGAGTTFSVDVPCAPQPQPAAALAQAPARRIVNFGRRIILVDDDDSVRTATAMFLTLEGHTVYSAATLREVDSLLDSIDDSPAIVISDFRLQRNESGRDAIERVRRRYGSALPAIVLTGDTSAIPARIFPERNTRVLNKPVDANLLVDTVGELLGG